MVCARRGASIAPLAAPCCRAAGAGAEAGRLRGWRAVQNQAAALGSASRRRPARLGSAEAGGERICHCRQAGGEGAAERRALTAPQAPCLKGPPPHRSARSAPLPSLCNGGGGGRLTSPFSDPAGRLSPHSPQPHLAPGTRPSLHAAAVSNGRREAPRPGLSRGARGRAGDGARGGGGVSKPGGAVRGRWVPFPGLLPPLPAAVRFISRCRFGLRRGASAWTPPQQPSGIGVPSPSTQRLNHAKRQGKGCGRPRRSFRYARIWRKK